MIWMLSICKLKIFLSYSLKQIFRLILRVRAVWMRRAVETGLAYTREWNYYPSSEENISCKDYHLENLWISFCNLFLLESAGKILETLYLQKMQVYNIKRSKAAEMLNLMRRKWFLKSGLALPTGCTFAGLTSNSVLVKLSLALALPLSHNTSLDQHSKDWASVRMPLQNKIFIGIVSL